MLIKNIVLLWCCLIAAFLTSCVNADASEENKVNQVRAATIIAAIDKYSQDHLQLPDRLDLLTPLYISELPKTTRGIDFSYRLDSLEGYYLCFGEGSKRSAKDFGCCFYHRLNLWDCTPGD